MPAAAVVGAAVVSAGASIYSGSKSAKAQKRAAEQAAQTEMAQYNQTRADQAPYREVGYSALDKLAGMYGLSTPGRIDYAGYVNSNPDLLAEYKRDPLRWGSIENYGKFHWDTYGQGEKRVAPTSGGSAGMAGRSVMDEVAATPGYQFRLSEGIKAAERSAASRGLLKSGASMKAIQRYGEGLAASEYDTYANRLAALAGVGQVATNATSAAGQGAAGAIANTQMAAGNAQASSYANTGAAISGAVGQVGQYFANQAGRNSIQVNPNSIPSTYSLPSYYGAK